MRQLIFSEEFGLYKVSNGYGLLGKGTNVETALANAFYGLTGIDLEIHNNAEVGQVLEDLLVERPVNPEAPIAP